MDLVGSFEPTYWLTQLRVAGDELRLLRAYPGKWQVRGRVNSDGPLGNIMWWRFRSSVGSNSLGPGVQCQLGQVL